MVQESSGPSKTKGQKRTHSRRSNSNDAESLRCHWYKGSPWDTKAPICIVEELDKLVYEYRSNSRNSYRPDKEFLESGIPEYVEWCVIKFINQYENIEQLSKYKEYRDLRKGIKDTDLRYLSTRILSKKGLRFTEDTLADIKLQVFLYYIVFLRSYKLIWRNSTKTHNKFSIYFRHSIFLKIGNWLRTKLDKKEYTRLERISYTEDIEYTDIIEPLGPKEISKLCSVSDRQIKKMISDPYVKQKLVDMKYLKTRNSNNVSRITSETDLAQDWGIHIQRIWEANHKERAKTK